MGKKTEKNPACYCVTFPLKTEKWQEDVLKNRLEHLRRIYNKCVGNLRDLYKKKEKEWVAAHPEEKIRRGQVVKDVRLCDFIKDSKSKTSLFSSFNYEEVARRCSAVELGNDTTYSNIGLSGRLLSKTIGMSLNLAFSKFLKGEGKRVYFKRKGEFNTMKVDTKGKELEVDLEKRVVSVLIKKKKKDKKRMEIPFTFNPNHEYECHALRDGMEDLRMTAITRKVIRGREKYYLQLTVGGVPYNKGRKLGKGVVGIDPGTASVTCYGKTIEQFALPKDILEDEEKVGDVQAYLDRSRRANNPDCFDEKGRYIKGKKISVKSKRYLKAQNTLRELRRKVADKRKLLQITFINEKLLPQGNIANVEKNDIKKWGKRKEGITVKENGKIASNKTHGKAIGNYAPSQLLQIYKNKMTAMGGTYNEIPESIAATATDHTDIFKRTKRTLKERTVTLADGTTHDRDTHAAFNLKHYNLTTNSYDKEEMEEDYPNFCEEEKKAWNILKYQN